MRTLSGYRLCVYGYVAGMALSILGYAPAGLLLLSTTSAIALALFISRRSPRTA